MKTRRAAALENSEQETDSESTRRSRKASKGAATSGDQDALAQPAVERQHTNGRQTAKKPPNEALRDVSVEMKPSSKADKRKKRKSLEIDEQPEPEGAVGMPAPKSRRKGSKVSAEGKSPHLNGDNDAHSSQPAEVSRPAAEKHSSRARKPAAIRTAAHPGDDDSNDDAPEEVSMAAGKATATQQRQQERAAAAQKRATVKARSQKRAAVAAEQKADRDAQRAAKAAQEPVAQPSSAGREPKQDEEDDLLPPEVLAAVAKQSQEAERARSARALAAPAADAGAPKAKAAKRNPSQPRKVGPVYVHILDHVPARRASASAIAFARQRMFGGGKVRSSEMLAPTHQQMKAAGLLPATRGPAAKFV
ncbi:hypothetical protein CVIRNUC_008815 [Coccomyxa viridis]|uniref:Uncharacterized protein n=1 Tax=Coccomyxa viridis TaxID=1274662 RepID=A0AAV1IEV1_9CHLO|nr:hypothetical protein CVIRNUC_008815 [Coccomyxa viridis]